MAPANNQEDPRVGLQKICKAFATFLLVAFLTPHLFGVCLDDIIINVILLNNKSHVIFMTCIIDYFAYRHLVYK